MTLSEMPPLPPVALLEEQADPSSLQAIIPLGIPTYDRRP